MTSLVAGAAAAFGVTVGLRYSPDREAAVRAALPYWWRDADPAEAQAWWTVAEDLDSTISELELWVAEHAAELTFVHAGAVAVHGRALLLPGRSLSGKSTLVAELLRLGADYLSDEYACIDARGLVNAYPRPLSLRTEGGVRRAEASAFGASTITGPVPVAMIAALTYDPRTTYAVASMSPAQTILALLDNTVCAATRPEFAVDMLDRSVAGAEGFAGVRGDAAQAAPALLSALGRYG